MGSPMNGNPANSGVLKTSAPRITSPISIVQILLPALTVSMTALNKMALFFFSGKWYRRRLVATFTTTGGVS